MLRIIIVACLMVTVAGVNSGYGSSGGSYGYGGSGGYGYGGSGGYGYGGSGGYGYGGSGGYGYGGKGGYGGYGGKGGYSGYSGYGKGGGQKKGGVDYLSQTFIPLSSPSLPDFTLTGRDSGSKLGSGLGLLAAFGAFAILFALTRN
ncbi:glycine-rich cell wall structural protein-like [Mizuhopecten yessoensis]|uniref:glycine-rich cell wall structural protein-like n=1 Tax=Mizuhopecten yessoensis TaxID=6573 RepID=UPI000B45DA0E|nr:glycine-rich cell wall structural protein-like [Mizuhopecten yessoensis]